MTFAKRLKLILDVKNISQKEFANNISISESQLSRVLNNKRKPTLKEISKMVSTLKVPYECIMGEVPLFDYLLETRGLWS